MKVPRRTAPNVLSNGGICGSRARGFSVALDGADMAIKQTLQGMAKFGHIKNGYVGSLVGGPRGRNE